MGILKTFIPFVFILFFTRQCAAQQDSAYLGIVENYIHLVDSAYEYKDCYVHLKEDTSSHFSTNIAEGYLVDSLYNYTGWWVLTTTSNSKKDTVFKIVSLRISFKYNTFLYKNFYYKSNQLVYAEIKLLDKANKMEIMYSLKEFYLNGNLFHQENKIDSLPQENLSLRKLNLYKLGNNHLEMYFSE